MSILWVCLSDRSHLKSHMCELHKTFCTCYLFVSDIAIFVLKRDVKLQLTNMLSVWLSSDDNVMYENVNILCLRFCG